MDRIEKEMSDVLLELNNIKVRTEEIKKTIKQSVKEKVIVFIDMVDSTQFKKDHYSEPEVWLLRLHQFYSVLQSYILNSNGSIIKYIGDEIMASFNNCNDAQNLVSQVNEIQNELKEVTGFETLIKTCIDYGPVYELHLEGHKENDPQGNTVDRCARIGKYARPGTVLASKYYIEKETNSKWTLIGTPELKGIGKEDVYQLGEKTFDINENQTTDCKEGFEPNSKCITLSLSGGGYKGLFTAHVLTELEEALSCKIAKKFDLISGTSIGGIIALALALEIPAQEIENLFIKNGKDIFKKRCWFSNGLIFRSKYSNNGLHTVLEELFKDKTIGDLKHRVLVTAVNYTDGKPQMFKTPHSPSIWKDQKMKLVDVAMSTSAAPMFFPVNSIKEGDFVDGGLVANHPGFFAMFEAEKYLGKNITDIYQLHIGTISQKYTFSSSKYEKASSFFSWKQKLFNLLFSCQEQTTDNLLNKYLGERYASIDSEIGNNQSKNIAIDKVSDTSTKLLIQKADNAVKTYMGTPHFETIKQYVAKDFIKGAN